MALPTPEFIPPDLSIPRAIPRDGAPPSPMRGDVRHQYQTIAARLERAVETVSRRIAINPSSRVARWRRALQRLSEADKREVLEQLVTNLQNGNWDHPFRDSFVALTESRVFIEIVEQLVDYLSERDLRELLSGHPDPSLDSANARGRDKEFEWFIAAIFRRAGLFVAFAEPDLLLKFGGGIRSIAAKRLSSRKQVDSNIKKASAQILQAGYPGYIFLEITRYIDPEVQFTEHWLDEGEAVRSRMDAVASKPALFHRRNELVEGAFLRAAFPLISPGFVYGTSEHWTGVAVRNGAKEEHIKLAHVLLSGVRGV
jgi:hypothetical protein